jgi:RimJ/RimL family protein N-acetyltransferase
MSDGRSPHEVPVPLTLDDVSWPVETARLSLRRAVPADLEATWRFRRLESVCRWTTLLPSDLEQYRARFQNPDRFARTLVIELDGVVIGDLMVGIKDGWAQAEVADEAAGVEAELGWSLDPEYGGRGLATEAVEGVLQLCFETLGLRRVVANCYADNEPSWRLMERVGMRREAYTVGDSLHRSRGWLDGMSYGLLAEEWRACRT